MSRLYKQQVVNQINSWDVFDTLLFRLCKDPVVIFNIVEEKFPNFTERRIEAEKRNGTSFDIIYENMKKMYGYSDSVINEMKIAEFNAELNNIYPIVSMIEQVKPDDILVSDMYYSESIIRLFLQKSGMKLNNKIFVSYGGKATGSIWSSIRNMGYSIKKHTGDNPVSDGKIPEKLGIPTRIIEISNYTSFEKMICENVSTSLGNIMRYIRLMTPIPKDGMEGIWYFLQSQYNIPILISYCNYIRNKFKTKKKYFIARDSYYLFKIYNIMYPDDDTEYIYSSRMSLYYPTSDFIEYIKSLDRSAIWIDLHGTGLSFNSFFGKYIGDIPRLQFCIGSSSHNLTNVESIMVSHDCIELLNEPTDNSLIFYEKNPTFINEEIKPHRIFTNYCMNNLYNVLNGVNNIEIDKCIDIIKNLYSSINYSQVPYRNFHTIYHYMNALKTLEEKSPKTHLLLFHTDGNDGGINLTNESNFLASTIGTQFDYVVQMTPSNCKNISIDFDSFYKNYENKSKKDCYRTHTVGFCAWKPWIISRYLERMNAGDILLYHDTNCSRHPYYSQNQQYMKGFLQFLLKISGDDISLAWEDPEVSKSLNYVKQEVIEDICSGSLEFSTEYPLLTTNRIIIRKSEKSVSIISEWEKYCKKKKYIIQDYPPQLSGFKYHKHDQSILTAIIAKKIRKGELQLNFPNYSFSGKIFNFDSVRTHKWPYEKFIETLIKTINVSNIIVDVSNNDISGCAVDISNNDISGCAVDISNNDISNNDISGCAVDVSNNDISGCVVDVSSDVINDLNFIV